MVCAPGSYIYNNRVIDQSKLTLVVEDVDNHVVYTRAGAPDSYYDAGTWGINRYLPYVMGWTPVEGREYNLNLKLYYDGLLIGTADWTFTADFTGKEYPYNVVINSEEQGMVAVSQSGGAFTMSVTSITEGFIFDGWYDAAGEKTSSDLSYTVTPVADCTYTAKYIVPANPTYEITWIVDGVPTTVVVEEGVVPTFPGIPTKAASEWSAYTFTGWDVTPVAANGNATYTATFKAEPRTDTVTIGIYGTGFENWSDQTQLLIQIPEAWRGVINPNTHANYTWDVTFTWTENGEEKSFTGHHWKPTSTYSDWLVRFETCLYEEAFVPVKGVKYTVSMVLSTENPEFNNEVLPRYCLSNDAVTWVLNNDPIVPEPDYITGDFDGDGKLGIADVTVLLNYLAADTADKENYPFTAEQADLDGQNGVTIGDVTALLNILAGKTQS